MSLQSYQWIFLLLMFLMANLPWISQRCFLILECQHKSAAFRLLEWLLLYLIVGLMGYLLEGRLMGTNHVQDWEFFAVTTCLFMVFAFPGFVYRYVRA